MNGEEVGLETLETKGVIFVKGMYLSEVIELLIYERYRLKKQ